MDHRCGGPHADPTFEQVMHSYFDQKLRQGDPDAIARWLKKSYSGFSFVKGGNTASMMIYPVQKNKHWFVVVVFLRDKTVYILDSNAKRLNQAHKDACSRFLRNFLSKVGRVLTALARTHAPS